MWVRYLAPRTHARATDIFPLRGNTFYILNFGLMRYRRKEENSTDLNNSKTPYKRFFQSPWNTYNPPAKEMDPLHHPTISDAVAQPMTQV